MKKKTLVMILHKLLFFVQEWQLQKLVEKALPSEVLHLPMGISTKNSNKALLHSVYCV